MPRETTIGRLLLEDSVPEDLRPGLGTLDAAGINNLSVRLAENHPEKYREVMKRISDLSNKAGFESGGFSFGPEDMAIGPAAHARREQLRNQVASILARRDLHPNDRDDQVVRAALDAMDPLHDAVKSEATAAKNPLALQVLSGAKGSGNNLRALISGDVLYLDQHHKPIPYPVLHSFGEGLRPHEYLAAAAGARQAIVKTKMGTADGGWLAKRISNVVHRLLVTSRDGEDPHGGVRGLVVDLNHPDNEGATLARDLEGYPRNTTLTRPMIADLKRRGVKSLLVRSPIVGGPSDGGVYGLDVGVRERGGVAPRGDYVGLAAGQSLAEPLTQMLLSSKHGGNVAGATKGQVGFPAIERLFAIPAAFPGGSTHAQRDGLVNDIRESPQGGREIIVDGEAHHAGPDLDPVVKAGDRVEAGDPLTDGIERPDEFVRHKGVGEARRRFLDTFDKQAKAGGLKYSRRNLELVARGLIDHVEMTKEYEDHVPGDIVSYTALEHRWRPREGHKVAKPRHVEGQYLEKPVLHYTVGTRITPQMTKMLGEHGVDEVTAHPEPPPWEPVMIRSNDNLSYDPDWTTQMLGSGLYSSLLDSMASGAAADPGGTSYVPALSAGVGFGDPGTKTRGWDRSEIQPIKT